MSSELEIGSLFGGGIILGYACSSKCRHCLYGSGPHRRDGKPDTAELEHLLDTLQKIAPQARYHIGGGEPFLDLDLLNATIKGMGARRLLLEYVETNASWVKSEEQAELVLSDLSHVGLDCVLVNVSPFHAEYIPFDKTKTHRRGKACPAERGLGYFSSTPRI